MSMKKEIEEREKIWEKQHKIREEFLEADLKKKRTKMGTNAQTKR